MNLGTKTLVALLFASLGCATLSAQKAVDFEKEVFPILEESCLRCHKAPKKDRRGRVRKPKGELRLDGRGWILQGGHTGPVLKPKDPKNSTLWVRTTLEEDHPDVMPQGADLLTKAQQDLIERWILEGASFGDWKGAEGGKIPDAKPTNTKPDRWAELARGLSPLPGSLPEGSPTHPFTLRETRRGLPLLRAETFSFVEHVNDQAIARLIERHGPHLSHLYLGGCKLSDKALARIAKLPRLVHLDLRDTAVTPSGLKALKKAPHLEVLNLVGTPVDGRSVDALAACSSLKRLYLFGSKIEEEDVAALREKLPQTKISASFTGPSDKPKPRERRAGRRRKN